MAAQAPGRRPDQRCHRHRQFFEPDAPSEEAAPASLASFRNSGMEAMPRSRSNLGSLLRLGNWSDADEAFQMQMYEARLRRGLAVWNQMVTDFYQRPATVGGGSRSGVQHHPIIAAY